MHEEKQITIPWHAVRRKVSFFILFATFCIVTKLAAQPSCEPWVWTNPSPQANGLNGVVRSGQEFVAVGDRGMVLGSPDGRNWSIHDSGVVCSLKAAATSGEVLVIVGGGGCSLVKLGAQHYARTAFPSEEDLDGVVWDGARFLAVGRQGGVYASDDGIAWDQIADLDARLSDIAWHGSTGVTVSPDGLIFVSDDGQSWTAVGQSFGMPMVAVAASDVGFVAVGADSLHYFGEIYFSPDGTTWTRQYGDFSLLSGAGWVGDRYLVVGSDGLILSSEDGNDWGEEANFGAGDLLAVAGESDVAVAVGGYGILVGAFSAEPWELLIEGPIVNIEGIVSGEPGLVAVGWPGDIMMSADGGSWELVRQGEYEYLWGGTWGDGQFVVVGSGGAVLTSSDGRNWVLGSAGVDEGLIAAAYGDSRFVAVGTDGVVVTSVDGSLWIRRGTPTREVLRSVAWGGEGFVVVGLEGVILHSETGLQWSRRESGTEQRLFGVTFGAGRFVAVGEDGIVAISTDGLEWQLHDSGTSSWLDSITWGAGQFVAVGGGRVWKSTDGLTWQEDPVPSSVILNGVAFHDEQGFVAGYGGTILSQSCSASEIEAIYIAGAAHVVGAEGSLWRSDLSVYNEGATSARFDVDLLPWRQPNLDVESMTFSLAPGSSLRYDDVLDSLFDFEGSASLRITATAGKVSANVRTYNLSPDGTYGQFVEGVGENLSFGAGDRARAFGLRQDLDGGTGYRTNIGLVNTSSRRMNVVIEIYTAAGGLLGVFEQTLRPYESVQLNELFKTVLSEDLDDGFVILETDTGEARFLAYASVIDNRSNDAVFIPAR